MDTSAAPTCPECGFRIYNRRYPNCESCGAPLSESLVYSPVERFMLQLEEERQSLEKARRSASEVASLRA
jgi:predicted amidophosphoribosyltransferase